METGIAIPRVEFTPPKDFKRWLTKHNACSGPGQGMEFCEEREYDFFRVWDECTRPDWMLWILQRLIKSKKADASYRLFACWCLRQVWDQVTDERSRNAVIVVEKYALGKATKKELWAARDAVWPAAWSVAMFVAMDDAGSVARTAVRYAARNDAKVVARDDAVAVVLKKQADRLREIFIPGSQKTAERI